MCVFDLYSKLVIILAHAFDSDMPSMLTLVSFPFFMSYSNALSHTNDFGLFFGVESPVLMFV